MATVASEMTSPAGLDKIGPLAELADEAFESFCEDIASMFGVDMRCERQQAGVEKLKALHGHFKKVAADHLVHGQGAIDGTFHLLFDQGGVFILSGVVVMLPEKRILEEAKRGSIEDAANLQDAACEVGNLLVGTWDRIFRTKCRGHDHFCKAGSFIGKPWEHLGEIEWSAEAEVGFMLYEMTIEPYPSFKCAAVFPTAMLQWTAHSENELGGGTRSEESPANESQEAAVGEPAVPPSAPAASQDSPTSAVPTSPPVSPAREEHVPSPDSGAEQSDKPTTDVETPPDPVLNAVEVIAAAGVASLPADQPAMAASGESDLMFLDPAYVQSAPQGHAVPGLLRTPAAKIMDKQVVWAGPEDTVQDVIAKMQQHNCGYMLVGTNGTIEGLVSSSNILGAVSVYLRPMFAKWRRNEDDATLGIKVKWIMSRPVRTIRPDTTLAAAIECMRRCGGRCLPVVDENGGVQGIVTVFDMLLYVMAQDKSFVWKGRPPQAPALLI
jgi:CBS domain-containing protein